MLYRYQWPTFTGGCVNIFQRLKLTAYKHILNSPVDAGSKMFNVDLIDAMWLLLELSLVISGLMSDCCQTKVMAWTWMTCPKQYATPLGDGDPTAASCHNCN